MIEAFDMLHLKEIGCLCVTRIYGYMHGHVSEVNCNVIFSCNAHVKRLRDNLEIALTDTESKAHLALHTFALGSLGHAL